MSHKSQITGFVTLTIGLLNSLTTDLYESLMDGDLQDSLDTVEKIEELLTDLKETIKKDEF